MKLRARITRRTETPTHKSIHFAFPKGVRPFIRESILIRNIGPRPYSEATMWSATGETLVMYSARKKGNR